MAGTASRDSVDVAGQPSCDLGSLEPDAFAAVCEHLHHHEVAAVAASSSSLRSAVATNDRLWSSLFSRQFPEPWHSLTQMPSQQQHQPKRSGVVPGAWRDMFLRTHAACQQLRSTCPTTREWTTDTSAVTLAALHGSGPSRLTLTAQGSTVELRSAPPSLTSIQCYGHSARVSAAEVLELGGAVRRVGVLTASHDQTVRLWCANVDAESYESRSLPLQLLTPLRTLRGHQEAVTSLQLVAGTTGVTIAATGSKDRTVRLWGLAPLLASPVQKPQIATLRGHGAPVTCLAMAGGSGSGWEDSSWSGGGSACSGGSMLLSGSLDSRVKSWDPWTAACSGTAKCAAPVAGMQPAVANPVLQPHTLLVCGGSGVELLDLRCMRAMGAVALPLERVDQVHCFAQWGWDLAVGSNAGARVFDLRALSSSTMGTQAGSSSSGGRALPEHFRLRGHAGPVVSIHLDRHKVVTATDRYGEAPVRVWCSNSGDCLAELDNCQPTSASGSGVPAGQGEPAESQQAAAAETSLQLETAGEPVMHQQGGEAAAAVAGFTPQPQQYQRDWEGVTALACRGGVLMTGSSGGTVCERDYSSGGLPDSEQNHTSEGGAGMMPGKFWQYQLAGF